MVKHVQVPCRDSWHGRDGRRCLRRRRKVTHISQGKFDGIPDLVAKLAVAYHSLDVQVDIAPLDSVCKEAEPKSIGATLGDALRKVLLLSRLGLVLLQREVKGGQEKERRGRRGVERRQSEGGGRPCTQ